MAEDESNFEFGDKPADDEQPDLASRIDSLAQSLDSAVNLIDALRAEVTRLNDLRSSESTRHQNDIDELYRRIRSTSEVADAQESCITTSPTIIGGVTEGLESPDNTTWSGTMGTPVDIFFEGRTGYFHAGTQTLIGYVRKLRVNSCGRIYEVTGEETYGIDVPGDCP